MKRLIEIPRRIFSGFPPEYKFLVGIYLLGIGFLIFLRFSLLLVNWEYAQEIPAQSRFSVLLNSFVFGLRFDTVISGYILILPFLVLGISSFFKTHKSTVYYFTLFIAITLYAIVFAIGIINIPYFSYFFTNLTSVVFNYAEDFSFTIRMITRESYFLFFLLYYLVLLTSFVILLLRLMKKVVSIPAKDYKSKLTFYSARVILFIGFAVLLVLAIRGRLEEKSPIRLGTAYFSEYSFANQLGLNPTFTLLVTTLEDKKLRAEKIKLMEHDTAIKNVRESFGIKSQSKPTPISREIISREKTNEKNVILVIMESMASVRIGSLGNKDHLTPVLDSLAKRSITFNNFFTSGIHTYCGVFSTLFSHPIIWNKHPMKPSKIPRIHSIIEELKSNDYHTYFFVAHDDQFDNVGGFLYSNGFERVYCERDYPSEWILSTLGVPDHILFDEMIKKINSKKDDRPFFAAVLTASNHDPKIIPDGINFTPTAKKEDERLVQYCDWAIGQFLEQASLNDWFENTIFVFVSDHGRSIKQPYDVPITFFQSPFIIYSPDGTLRPEVHSKFSCQLDVMPTIAGLLNINYTNSTLGIDVLTENRPYVFFSNDNAMGVLSNKFFLIEKREGELSLFDYKSNSLINIIEKERIHADSMINYSHSMQQVSQILIENSSNSFPIK